MIKYGFKKTTLEKTTLYKKFLGKKQEKTENTRDYIAKMRKLARKVEITEDFEI